MDFLRGLLFIVLFLPAGTLRFWQAWVYMSVLFIPMLMVVVWLFRNDPAFLERRMRTREKGRRQRNIQVLGLPFYLGIYLIPGLDKRFGWSSVPPTVVLLADHLEQTTTAAVRDLTAIRLGLERATRALQRLRPRRPQ